MKLGIHFVNFTLPGGPEALGPTLGAAAQAAEEGGCAKLTLMDHWFQMDRFATAQDPMLEGYTGLGFLAGRTERITLSTLVTGVTYRHPGLLAKIVTTLDVVSGGRAQLGIGAGWYEREHKGLGVPFPRRRVQRADTGRSGFSAPVRRRQLPAGKSKCRLARCRLRVAVRGRDRNQPRFAVVARARQGVCGERQSRSPRL